MMQMAEKYILKLRTKTLMYQLFSGIALALGSGSALVLPNETSKSVLFFALFISDQQLTNSNVLLFNRKCQVVSALGNENCMFVVLSTEGTRVTSQQHLVILGGVGPVTREKYKKYNRNSGDKQKIFINVVCVIFLIKLRWPKTTIVEDDSW